MPVPPKPKGPTTQGITEYVDLTCDNEGRVVVSEVISGMEPTQFTSGVYKGMSLQQLLNSFTNEYQTWSKLSKPPWEIAVFRMWASEFQPPAKSTAG